MDNQIKALVGDKLKKLDLWIDHVVVEEEDGNTFLRIALDADRVIPLNQVVMATRIINPLLDKENLLDKEYVLDIYAKEKGDVISE